MLTENKLAVFLGHSGNGKSTLAAGVLRSGADLFTDDILPIFYQAERFWGHPGVPQINMWPDQTAFFIDNHEEKYEKVNPHRLKQRVPVDVIGNGTFCSESKPLDCIYISQKFENSSSETRIEVIPVSLAEAVIELARYSFIQPFLCERIGCQADRLKFFTRLVQQVPVRRLIYPSGFGYLERVTDAVRKDLKTLPSIRGG